MNEEQIKEICRDICLKYQGKVDGNDSVADLIRGVYAITSGMVAEMLIEYDRLSKK